MATKEETIKVKWAAHSDPSKVGTTEELRPREARAAVRTGQAQYVSEKDVPPARPSMHTRAASLEKAKSKDGDEAAPTDRPQTVADTDADGAALDDAVAAADSAQPAAKAPRKR